MKKTDINIETCNDCPYFVDEWYICNKSKKLIGFWYINEKTGDLKERPEWCPLQNVGNQKPIVPEIKPCKICGRKPTFAHSPTLPDGDYCYTILDCSDTYDGIHHSIIIYRENEKDAIEQWNKING
jgi:hypothetical protein